MKRRACYEKRMENAERAMKSAWRTHGEHMKSADEFTQVFRIKQAFETASGLVFDVFRSIFGEFAHKFTREFICKFICEFYRACRFIRCCWLADGLQMACSGLLARTERKHE
jgi:hypothetical protein